MGNVRVDTSIDDFLSSCNKNDIKEIITALREDGHLNEGLFMGGEVRSYDEEKYIQALNTLRDKWNRLSTAESEIITLLAKRFQ